MLFLATAVYSADTIWEYIKTQTSTSKGSNNSEITFSNKSTTYYINKDNNNSPIWDYLKWYYYDSKFWFFRLDWSDTKTKNTRIIWNTDKCSSGNWYKFWGFAYSKYVWYIKFDYNSDIFVYYCENDNKLHWYWYSKHLWFQAFEWIWFKIGLIDTTTPEIKDDGWFVNDWKTIKNDDTHWTNNWSNENIWGWDRYEIENATIIEWAWLFENNKSLFRIIR
jgi:hypothetical protein